MLRPPLFAGLVVAFLSAAPVLAESSGASDERRQRTALRYKPVLGETVAAPTLPPVPEAGLFEGTRPGLAISRQTFQAEDGSQTVRSGLIRSWAVTDGLSAGLGLFSVTHDDQKEPEFKRNWNAKNVGPRDRRVAAVGLNVRF